MGVTDGRTYTVTVGVDVPVSVITMRSVIVGVGEAKGTIVAGGSSRSELESGVGETKPGRNGVLDGGANAFRSSAAPCFQASGIDPVVSEQPNTNIAAAGQNIF